MSIPTAPNDYFRNRARQLRGMADEFSLTHVVTEGERGRCPHWLTTKGHRGMRELCDPWSLKFNILWDHPDTWHFADGTRIISLGPYGEPFGDFEDIKELEAALDPVDVILAFDTSHRWYQADYLLFLIPRASALGSTVADMRSRGCWLYTMRESVDRVLSR